MTGKGRGKGENVSPKKKKVRKVWWIIFMVLVFIGLLAFLTYEKECHYRCGKSRGICETYVLGIKIKSKDSSLGHMVVVNCLDERKMK